MNSKERVRRAIRHQEPDRVPVQLGKTPTITRRLSQLTGISGPELAIHLGEDILPAPFDPWGYYAGPSSEEGTTYVDYWGITRVWISQPAGGSYTDVHVCPLAEASIRDLDTYPWPDLVAHPSMADVEGFVETYGQDYFIVGGEVSIFEMAFNLIGYERFLSDLLLDRPFVTRLVEILTEIQVPAMVSQVEQGIDAVLVIDDPSTQRGMLIHPDLWREAFRPHYEYIIERAKAANADVVVANHNCGDCRSIIPDWIEMGMDVLYPIQPRAMDPAQLKREFGDDLCFWGAVDEQWVLPFGAADDVIDEVRLRIGQLGQGGGYILGPSHALQADTSVENVQALLAAAREFGTYPLTV